MAKRSLGPGWILLTDSEREEFVGLFVQMIRDAIANRLCEYTDQEILYLSEQRGMQFASVAAQLAGHKIPMTIEFRLMLHPAGAWLLYDAVIDGVSIVDNYRAQFAAVTRELPYAGLIAEMRQRTVLVKQFERESCL
jgi:phospholipid transport system substrate-binding protein